MVEKTVETEVTKIKEETVTFCDSCGDPIDDPTMFTDGDPEEIFDEGVKKATRTMHDEIMAKIHETQKVGIVGSTHTHDISMPTLKNETYEASDVSSMIDEAMKKAKKEKSHKDHGSYHFCDTCKSGLESTAVTLGAFTEGNEPEKDHSTGGTSRLMKFIENNLAEFGAFYAVILILAGIIGMAAGAPFAGALVITGPIIQWITYWAYDN